MKVHVYVSVISKLFRKWDFECNKIAHEEKEKKRIFNYKSHIPEIKSSLKITAKAADGRQWFKYGAERVMFSMKKSVVNGDDTDYLILYIASLLEMCPLSVKF